MSGNKSLPHVKVLPEDDANRQLALGFGGHTAVDTGSIQVLRVARGWLRVLELFESVHVREMDRHPRRYMVLLIDFDGQPNRLALARAKIPAHLLDRVFVLGVLTEPEELRASIGSYEKIGLAEVAQLQKLVFGVLSLVLRAHSGVQGDSHALYYKLLYCSLSIFVIEKFHRNRLPVHVDSASKPAICEVAFWYTLHQHTHSLPWEA